MKNLYFFNIILLFLFFTNIPQNISAQQTGVGINYTGAAPDSSAGLDVSFPDKGWLSPRMTTVQRNAITRPANGLTIFNTDCNVYNFNAGTPSAPNWVTSNSSNALVAGVSIVASPVGAICGGTSVTFTATSANGIPSPTYQWQINGGNVGTNSTTYTSTALNNGDVVTCALSSNAPCVSGSPATSNSITMTVNPVPATPGSITGTATICANSTGNTYSISPVGGATSYTWSVPSGASITAGAGSTSITVSYGSATGNIGNISVVANNACTTSSASTLAITINPSAPATPGAISGSTSGANGTTGNKYFVSPVANATTYTWTVPAGCTITAGQGTDSITVTYGNTSGTISVTAGNSCGTSSASTITLSICANGSGTQTFNYTGSQQTFTVPLCVYSIIIQAYGAAGANSIAVGGQGGYATGTLAVTPGQTLYIYVGGHSGWNGGGISGSQGGGYGGDGSDVRVGGTAFANRVIVAGGGGGGAGTPASPYGAGTGGNGGGLTGDVGGTTIGCGGCNYGGGGGGGTQSTGGAAGYGNCNTCGGGCGFVGGFGTGGAGVNQDHPQGGGGGGGYYGGGGGGSYCSCGGGGGGSSYISGLTNASTTTGGNSGTGQIVFNW